MGSERSTLFVSPQRRIQVHAGWRGHGDPYPRLSYGVALIGYCLMSNHIHLIAIPHKVDDLAQALKQTHGGMLPTGMRLTNRSDTSGNGDITLARWTSRTSGRRCAIPSSIR
jgi:hypothetical protein